ncbi:MAG TPA: outer membrane protein transport protein [Candidatus Hydrogenedentes bacterium]|nr:outer membrane protein transport protein [Candidatus Hydrogenedentota bacterium]HPG65704.1 outer membrane protein transport protein [Candidatus Hydrogenedentota bacterium]
MATEGVFLLGNDALQLGRASSGIASPRSAYWCYMNPASMVDLERRIDANWYTVFTDVELQPRGIIGNRLDGALESNGVFNIGSAGIVWPLQDANGVIGGGLYVPSGTGIDYPHSRNLVSRIFSGNADRRLSYQHMRLVLAYGYRFDNGWAIGAGLHGSLSRFKTDHITLRFSPCEADYDWEDALGAGFNLGVYKKWDRFAVGAAYTSRHWTQGMDDYDDLLNSPLDTPHIFQGGIAYKLTPKVEVTLDYKYLNWKSIGVYGGTLFECGFNWDDQHVVKTGIEWCATDRFVLMAGFSHGNSPVDEDHIFSSLLVPVAVEDHATVGVSYAINDAHEIHLAAVHAFRNTVRDTGCGDLLSILGGDTELSVGAESFVLGYTYKF